MESLRQPELRTVSTLAFVDGRGDPVRHQGRHRRQMSPEWLIDAALRPVKICNQMFRSQRRFAIYRAEGAISKKPRASDGPVSASRAALGRRKKRASAESATEG
jgi:hypothetical protein